MRGGGRMRLDGAWPSDRLLKDPKLAPRLSFGESGGVMAEAFVAVYNELQCRRRA